MKLSFPRFQGRRARQDRQRKQEIHEQRDSLRRLGGYIAPNVLRQGKDRDFGDLVKELGLPTQEPSALAKIAHIINLFTRDGNYDATQAATLDSIRRAKCGSATGHIVDLIQVASEVDLPFCPEGFVPSRPITRDIRDIAAFQRPRPLPFLWDVLDHGVDAATDAEIIIYSNADICLQPHFYDTVRTLFTAGLDAMTIDRRKVSLAALGSPEHLVSSETGSGHEGYDCFVFKRSLYNTFIRSDCCLGIPYVDRSLLYNLVARADRMLLVENAALTYHFGDDKAWKDPALADYERFNQDQQMATLRELTKDDVARSRLQTFCMNRQENKEVRSFLKHAFGATPEVAMSSRHGPEEKRGGWI